MKQMAVNTESLITKTELDNMDFVFQFGLPDILNEWLGDNKALYDEARSFVAKTSRLGDEIIDDEKSIIIKGKASDADEIKKEIELSSGRPDFVDRMKREFGVISLREALDKADSIVKLYEGLQHFNVTTVPGLQRKIQVILESEK